MVLTANNSALRATRTWLLILLCACIAFWIGLHYSCSSHAELHLNYDVKLESDPIISKSSNHAHDDDDDENENSRRDAAPNMEFISKMEKQLQQQQGELLKMKQVQLEVERLRKEKQEFKEKIMKMENVLAAQGVMDDDDIGSNKKQSKNKSGLSEDDLDDLVLDEILKRLNSSGASLEDLEKVMREAENIMVKKDPKRDPITGVIYDVEDKPPYGAPPDPNPKKDPKLYCFVLTYPKRHDPKAIAVNRTWGRRFDLLDFMTSEPFMDLKTVIFKIKNETRMTLWPKTKMAWMYVYENYVDKADWFMKADDDTYVMVDNLRKFLSKYDPDKPHFFGRHLLLHRGDKLTEHSYFSGGAGYVLSRGALKKLGENHEKAFKNKGTAEDVEMARSMKKLGIYPEDTRDEEGRETFIPLNIEHVRYKYTKKNKPKFWYWRYSYYPPRDGLECCSKNWIATHYIYSQDLYRIDKLYEAGLEGCGKDPEQPMHKYDLTKLPNKNNNS